ncbi:MAG: hypothetical protein ACLQOO_33740 [Terriglobia bacterium]
MSNPQIVYDPGTGPVALPFLRQPRRVPAYCFAATRHDNLASSGVRESIIERIDQFLELEMEYVALGSDVQNWSSFMLWALRGGQFAYYPDSSQTTFTNYWLEDTNWSADYKFAGQYTFKLKFRQVVT